MITLDFINRTMTLPDDTSAIDLALYIDELTRGCDELAQIDASYGLPSKAPKASGKRVRRTKQEIENGITLEEKKSI